MRGFFFNKNCKTEEFTAVEQCVCAFVEWPWSGRGVVRALDWKSGGRELQSRSVHLAGVVSDR